jgi:cytochrome c5
MKNIFWFAILVLFSIGPALAEISQQDFDRDMILMQEQVNQIKTQVDSMRKMIELEQQINSSSTVNTTLEGIMMGGQVPQGADPAELPEPHSPGATLVNHYCTQCHGLPTPLLHSDIGWPPVINRMGLRMDWLSNNDTKMGVFAPSPDELKTISEYMQKHAREFPSR